MDENQTTSHWRARCFFPPSCSPCRLRRLPETRRRQGAHRRRSEGLPRRGRGEAPLLATDAGARHLGSVHLHHRRHGDPRGPGQRAADFRRGLLRQAGDALRRAEAPDDLARKMKLLKLSLTLATPSDPKESEELTRITAAMEGAYGKGSTARPARTSASTWKTSRRSWPKAATTPSSRRLARLALDRAAAAQGLHPLRRSRQQGREGAGLRRQRGDVAFQVRHAARRLREGARPPLGAGQAALPLAPRLRPMEAAREVRRRGPRSGPDPGPPARQHVGADLGQRLPAHRPERRRSRLRPDRDPQVAQDRPSQMVRYGEGFFTSLGFDPLPKTFWERSAFHQAARPRGRLPRQRLGRRQRQRPPHQDVHRHHGRGLLDDPPRARPQLLPARLQHAALPLPRQRQRRLPRGGRRHDRPLDHPEYLVKLGLLRRRPRTPRRTSGCS